MVDLTVNKARLVALNIADQWIVIQDLRHEWRRDGRDSGHGRARIRCSNTFSSKVHVDSRRRLAGNLFGHIYKSMAKLTKMREAAQTVVI
jgi:hypothetical protein